MMIIFEHMRYKNMMGAGAAWIEIQLNAHKTTLVIGHNGSGKSSFMDCLTFALFGKPFRDIKKAQLINTINGKQAVVEVRFTIGTKKYLVRRGIKPDLFEIYQDDKLIDQPGSARDYQLILEDQILRLNHKTFIQVVLLSVANFKPFMQLDTQLRREIIEDILDIKIFSEMNGILKQRASTLKEQLRDVEASIDLQRQKIEVQEKYVATLKQDRTSKVDSLQQLIAEAEQLSIEYSQRIDEHTTRSTELYDSIADQEQTQARKTKLQGIAQQINSKLSTLNETIAFYKETEQCPTCKQHIDDVSRQQQISENEAKSTEMLAGIEKLQSQLATLNEREAEIAGVVSQINVITQEIHRLNSSIMGNQSYIKRLHSEIATLQSNQGDLAAEEVKIKELAEGALHLVKQKAALSETKQYQDIAATLLKDSGIKTKIIAQYLPVINKLINMYLAKMDTWIHFYLDEEFNETIKSRYRDTFTYNSFSEGEKQRIDLAILFTWRTIAKMKNSVNCNLLIFDEILDRALDLAGTEHVTNLLDTLGEGTNVFVISHRVEQLQDKFTKVLQFQKVNNFSQIVT